MSRPITRTRALAIAFVVIVAVAFLPPGFFHNDSLRSLSGWHMRPEDEGSGGGHRHLRSHPHSFGSSDYAPYHVNTRPKDQHSEADLYPSETEHGHIFHANGLIEVNASSHTHPIDALIAHAETQWFAKLSRQSTTLSDAVAEYRRRYGRSPPKGFDLWFGWARAHGVELLDEYDRIHYDLEPYWGIAPADLDVILERGSDALKAGNGPCRFGWLGKNRMEERTRVLDAPGEIEEDQRQIIEGAFPLFFHPVDHLLPPFRMLVTREDFPVLTRSWAVRERMIRAGREGSYLNISHPIETPIDHANPWFVSCPPDSPMHTSPPDWTVRHPLLPNNSLAHPKSFIHSTLAALDPCAHPHLLQVAGVYLHALPTANPPPGDPFINPLPDPHPFPFPILSASTLPLTEDLPAPCLYNFFDFAEQQDRQGHEWEWVSPRWEDKTDERLLWRGSTTGAAHRKGNRWRETQRMRLMDLTSSTQQQHAHMRVLDSPIASNASIGRGVLRSLRDLNAMTDISFASAPFQCDEEACRELEELYDFDDKRMDYGTEGRYKYILDVDGNGWSSRFQRLLGRNSLIFKSTVHPEWNSDRFQPWVHYVPIKADLSDLYDSLLYFRGSPFEDGVAAHDEAARRIAQRGGEWVRRAWRKQDVTAYYFRFILEYARLFSPDRDAMSYEG